MPRGDGTGPQGKGAQTGKGMGGSGRRQGGGSGLGPDGNCLCPNCGEKTPHSAGTPCKATKCPKCGAFMIRE